MRLNIHGGGGDGDCGVLGEVGRPMVEEGKLDMLLEDDISDVGKVDEGEGDEEETRGGSLVLEEAPEAGEEVRAEDVEDVVGARDVLGVVLEDDGGVEDERADVEEVDAAMVVVVEQQEEERRKTGNRKYVGGG